MAVVITLSAAITNAEAATLTDRRVIRGPLIETVGVAATLTADSATSQYRPCRVLSSDRISKVEVACTGQAGLTNCDIGIWDIASGSPVVTALFASSLCITSYTGGFTNVTYESGTIGIEDIEKPLWEAAGLTADPCKPYDIVVYPKTTGPKASGSIAMKVSAVG
jgi:hypothetical protein